VGRAERFERRLEGFVGDAFARVFGGNVVTEEVSQALVREAEVSVRPLAGGRQLARIATRCCSAPLTMNGWPGMRSASLNH